MVIRENLGKKRIKKTYEKKEKKEKERKMEELN